tara:strand:+ start:4259 stop:5467 length:1209 start_codon:yes stop_codon:yes gene_type:complete
MSTGILQGLRVVEIGAFVAAPLGGLTLAQMGAEVIRIDPPSGGLDYRRWPVTEDNISLFWAGLNKFKRSVTIDFNKPEGRELVQALIVAPGEDAGILLTNFPPRSWLNYEALKAKRSDLIQLTIQGDHKGKSAVDYTVNAKVGVPYLTGPVGHKGAVNHVLPTWDLITGQMAVVGLLAAERHRRRTGEGQHIKLALEDVALATIGNLGLIAEAQLYGERARYGNDLFGAFGRDFVTRDDARIMVMGLTTRQWRSLCIATGIGAQIKALAEQFKVNLDLEGERFTARREIAAIIGPWIAARPLSEVATIFDAHSVCWDRYQSIKQLVTNDPACSEENPMFRTVQQSGVGNILSSAIPLDFDAGRLPAEPTPELGADTEEVLSYLLGLSSSEIGYLQDRGVVRI